MLLSKHFSFSLSVSSKMSSTTSKLSLFRNYNYVGGEKADKFIVNPDEARRKLGFKPRDKYQYNFASNKNYVSTAGSRHDGSFRVLQRAALRATTAAPTVFKPVVMGGEIYSDGGIVASNPTAVAIHEARTLFPDIPIELCVSCGTGEFVSERVSPSFGWDGIVSQIVKSATDTAKTHWVLEDILGQGNTCNGASGVSDTKYFRVSFLDKHDIFFLFNYISYLNFQCPLRSIFYLSKLSLTQLLAHLLNSLLMVLMLKDYTSLVKSQPIT
jgi:hypothetical protein